MNAQEIKARSIEINKSVKAIGTDIHNHLLSIMKHIAEHRDTTLATHFLNLMVNNDKAGDSRSIVRADAVKNWFEAFAFVTWAKAKDGKAAFKLNKTALDSLDTAEAMKEHVGMAKANPWNVYTKAKPLASFDLVAAIKAAVERAEKAQKNPEDFKSVKIDADKLATLKSLIEG